MPFFIYKAKRKRSGKHVQASTYRMRYWLEGEPRRDTPLNTSDKRIAETKAAALFRDHEHEKLGLLAPKAQRVAARAPASELITSYIQDLRQLRRATKYCQITEIRLRKLFTDCSWKHLGDVSAVGFQMWRIGQTKAAAKTLNHYLVSACSFMNWLKQNGQIGDNPLLAVEKAEVRGKEVRIRRAFTDAELLALLSVAGPRMALYLAAVHTGFRRAELASLRWSDMQLDGPTPFVRIRSSTSKNHLASTMPLHPELAECLRERRASVVDESAYTLPRLDRMTQFRKDLEAAGVPFLDEEGRRADFHAFRHTFATRLQVHGVGQRSAMDLMRHADPRLTAKVYTDSRALPLAESVQKLPSIFRHASPVASPILFREGPEVSATVQNAHASEFAQVVVGEGKVPDCPPLSAISRDGLMAPVVGLEPTTCALTVRCSTIELHRNK